MQLKARYISTQVRWKLRSLLPDSRDVCRHVQGVDLWMPRAHRLADFARAIPTYGLNLVQFAKVLDAPSVLQFIDVGANIGDSTVQILDARDGAALCIEADGYWLPFLEKNTDSLNVTVAHNLLVPDGQDETQSRRPVRNNQGTTHFSLGDDAGTGVPIQISELPDKFGRFDNVRLIKSDTDGYDALLVPALARTYAASVPALFFEFDIALSCGAGNSAPENVFSELATLGYREFVAWDNYGLPVGTFGIDTLDGALDRYRRDVDGSKIAYWDIATVHREDSATLVSLAQLTRDWDPLR